MGGVRFGMIPYAPRRPVISLNPQVFNHTIWYGETLPTDTFAVANVGAGAMSYTIASGTAWMSVSPASGASSGQLSPAAVTYDVAGLPPGSYTGTVMVTASGATNSPQLVTVNLVVDTIKIDFDKDGDVDQSDFGHFQACLSGPSSPQYDSSCQDAKLDDDGDVDQLDFGVFQACVTGAGAAIDPACIQ
jgi:hypothetical protein